MTARCRAAFQESTVGGTWKGPPQKRKELKRKEEKEITGGASSNRRFVLITSRKRRWGEIQSLQLLVTGRTLSSPFSPSPFSLYAWGVVNCSVQPRRRSSYLVSVKVPFSWKPTQKIAKKEKKKSQRRRCCWFGRFAPCRIPPSCRPRSCGSFRSFILPVPSLDLVRTSQVTSKSKKKKKSQESAIIDRLLYLIIDVPPDLFLSILFVLTKCCGSNFWKRILSATEDLTYLLSTDPSTLV